MVLFSVVLLRTVCFCGFVGVGLGLLHVVGGINVASRWGCVQGVWVQCRCWSLGMGSRVSNVVMGLHELQLKTVIVTLLYELESGGACVCARARAWYSVVCGQWAAWCAHWPFNRME